MCVRACALGVGESGRLTPFSPANKDELLKFRIQTKLNVKVQRFSPLLIPTFCSVADK